MAASPTSCYRGIAAYTYSRAQNQYVIPYYFSNIILRRDINFRTTTLKILTENCMLIGTNVEIVLQCSLYGKKFKKYRKTSSDNSKGIEFLLLS